MALSYSPLRYPGGKSRLAYFMKLLLKMNNLHGGVYAEPFAGGSGVALALLLDDYVEKIVLNDVDPAIYAFWHSVIHHSDELCRKIADTHVTMDEWGKQRRIFSDSDQNSLLDLGFATFFLNRTNRSGILNAGAIGGQQQTGQWKLNARYQKASLIKKIEDITALRHRIELHNLDARVFIRQCGSKLPEKSIIYFDPPYFKKGQRLYLNALRPDDHILLAHSIFTEIITKWVVSYDNVSQIRDIYTDYAQSYYSLNYTAASRYQGSEIIIHSHDLEMPDVENPFRVTKRQFNALNAA